MRTFLYGRELLKALAVSVFFIFPVTAKQHPDANIQLLRSVELTAQEQLFVSTLPALKIASHKQAPPMSLYDRYADKYTGISVDLFCFIANEIGLPYQFIGDGYQSFSEMMADFEEGHIDVLMPVSISAERSKQGLFADGHYDEFYAVVARKSDRLHLLNSQQLSEHRIGVIEQASIIPYLQSKTPQAELHAYKEGVIYEALRRNKIDVAVLNKGVFVQDRIRLELFDLDNIFTLYDFPRNYSFLFKNTADNQKIIEIFNRYIAATDLSASVRFYEDGESQLIKKYTRKQSEQQLVFFLACLVALLFIGLVRISRARKRILDKLAQSHAQIVEQHHALQAANKKLEYLNRTDELTQLANRRYFDQQLALEHMRHQRSGAALSLLMVDIDHFKSINDHYGHAIGDVYLQKIAAVLSTVMSRSNDLAARYGGEEFVCILPDTDLSGALQVAEEIRLAVMAVHLDNTEVLPQAVTVSVGVATLQGSSCSVVELLKQADMQLYCAKDAGRNCVCGILLAETCDHSS